MSGKVSDVKHVEDIPKDVQLVSFAEPENLAEPNVHREERIPKIEIRRKSDSWNHLTDGSAVQDCDRLIVDMRGNSGGGIGGLRLMSYLTPEKLPIGYSLSRARAKKGYKREELTRFERIPSRKITLLWLLLRYGFVDHSVALFTEGLGPQKFHGRVALLVNEYSASASEMIAAFVAENHLAKIIGTTTPGRLVGSKAFKLPDGYFLILPVGAFLTWQGKSLEGQGVKPDIEVPLSYQAISNGRDNQLEVAIEVVKGL